MDQEFLKDTKNKAKNVWKWRSPWIAAILAFIHPLGMLYNSAFAFFVYFILWIFIALYWQDRPAGVGFFLALIFSVYAFTNTRWKNAAIEKWKYDLPGTGMQNPNKIHSKSQKPLAKKQTHDNMKYIIILGAVIGFFLLIISLRNSRSGTNRSNYSNETTIDRLEEEIEDLENEVSDLERCMEECKYAVESAQYNLEQGYYQDAYSDLYNVGYSCW